MDELKPVWRFSPKWLLPGWLPNKEEWYKQRTEVVENHAYAKQGYLEAKTLDKAAIAEAKQGLSAAQTLHDQHSWWGATKRGTGTAVGAVGTAAAAPFKLSGKVLRGAGWTAAIAGGLGALAYFASNSRDSRKLDVSKLPDPEPIGQDLPPVLDLTAQPQVPAIAEPAEGRGPTDWQNTVAVQRGGIPASQRAAAVNPRMNVVPEANVQDLGAPASRA